MRKNKYYSRKVRKTLEKVVKIPSELYFSTVAFTQSRQFAIPKKVYVYLLASPKTITKIKLKTSCLAPNGTVYLMDSKQYHESVKFEKEYARKVRESRVKFND